MTTPGLIGVIRCLHCSRVFVRRVMSWPCEIVRCPDCNGDQCKLDSDGVSGLTPAGQKALDEFLAEEAAAASSEEKNDASK